MECNFENCPNFERLGKQFADRISELEQENERLKARVKEIGEKMSFLNADRCSEIIELKQTLQEIKAIAEDAYENESEYQATGVYNEILQKITKAEEE